MTKPRVFFINGICDDAEILIRSLNVDQSPVYSSAGSCNVYTFIDNSRLNTRLLTLGPGQENIELVIPEDVIVFNQISEPDTHQMTLHKLLRLQAQNTQNIWINQPQYVLENSRDQLSEKLSDIPGVIMPRTLRAHLSGLQDLSLVMQEHHLTFPLIIRTCGVHAGNEMVLLSHKEDLAPLFALPLDGRPFYLTQFYDYQEDGLYTKYRIVVVAGKAYLRTIDSGEKWKVHYQSHHDLKAKDSVYYHQRERELLESFEQKKKKQIQTIITQIYEAIKLDYFGIDCHLSKEGKLCIFEANANMNVLENDATPEMRMIWDNANQEIKDAIVEMILTKAL